MRRKWRISYCGSTGPTIQEDHSSRFALKTPSRFTNVHYLREPPTGRQGHMTHRVEVSFRPRMWSGSGEWVSWCAHTYEKRRNLTVQIATTCSSSATLTYLLRDAKSVHVDSSPSAFMNSAFTSSNVFSIFISSSILRNHVSVLCGFDSHPSSSPFRVSSNS